MYCIGCEHASTNELPNCTYVGHVCILQKITARPSLQINRILHTKLQVRQHLWVFNCSASPVQRIQPDSTTLFPSKWFWVSKETSQSADHDDNLSTNRRDHHFTFHFNKLALATVSILQIADSQGTNRCKNQIKRDSVRFSEVLGLWLFCPRCRPDL